MDNLDKMPCLPVKITDKQWADKLQDGSVFMRSLYEYGSWSAVARAQSEDNKMKSGVQGDIMEGLVRRVDPRVGDEFFNCFEPSLRKAMKEAYYIDEDRYQYSKVYCMYGLTYLLDKQCYMQPDERVRGFGNTAVIILNPNEFLDRLIRGLLRTYGDNVNLRMDEVHYYSDNYYGALNEFCKRESFAWQNEMRIRVYLLDPNNCILDEEGRERKRLIQNRKPITVDIGDIRDISVQIPVEDLIRLHLPEQIRNPQFTIVEEVPPCPTST